MEDHTIWRTMRAAVGIRYRSTCPGLAEIIPFRYIPAGYRKWHTIGKGHSRNGVPTRRKDRSVGSRYTQPVAKIVQLFKILYHFFANDSQLYRSLKAASMTDQTSAKSALEECISHIADWMFSNILKLNMDKTEFITFGTRQQLDKISLNEITYVKKRYQYPQVRNLGVHLDQNLTMKLHVSHVINPHICTYGKFAP